ncbi:hypothetical protein AB3A32_002609 [Vibrio alginolyticus]
MKEVTFKYKQQNLIAYIADHKSNYEVGIANLNGELTPDGCYEQIAEFLVTRDDEIKVDLFSDLSTEELEEIWAKIRPK